MSAASAPVVVGVDDGLLRMPVLDRAVAEARRRGHSVRVVHAHGPASPPAPWYDDAGPRAEAYLHRTAADVDTHRSCTHTDPAEALAAAAGPDSLIVLGDRRRRLGSEAGSTTAAVVDAAPCPVLVVGEARPPAPRPAEPGGAVGSVVVGVDGSPRARTVLAHAVAMADGLERPLEVVRVCEDVAYTADGELRRQEVDADLLAATRDELAALVSGVSAPAGVTGRVVEDRAARALLEAGDHAALLVLGHRAGSAPDRVGLGSTARAVLAGAPCPVLVVGPRVSVDGSEPTPVSARSSR